MCYSFRQLFSAGCGARSANQNGRWRIVLIVSIGALWVGCYSPDLISNMVSVLNYLSRVPSRRVLHNMAMRLATTSSIRNTYSEESLWFGLMMLLSPSFLYRAESGTSRRKLERFRFPKRRRHERCKSAIGHG